jgi:hypothetical protein
LTVTLTWAHAGAPNPPALSATATTKQARTDFRMNMMLTPALGATAGATQYARDRAFAV